MTPVTAWAVRALAAVATVAWQSQAAPTALAGDLLLFNGKIHTMDAADTVASVVAVKAGKVVYVGDSQDAARSSLGDAAAATKMVDLGGRLALPGLIDDHNHIVLMGNRPGYHTPLENAYSVADAQDALRARVAGGAVPQGEFVTTIGGFHFNQFRERRLPTLAELDAAVPDRPVFLSVSFSGPSVTNSLGRAHLTSLADASLRPAVGADGSMAAGQETGKTLLALRRRLTLQDRKRGARDAMAYAAAMGVTTHLDQGAFPATGTPSDGAGHEDLAAMHDPWLAVHADGEATVRLRINHLHMDADADLSTLRARLRDTKPFAGDDMVRTGGVGEFISIDSASGGPLFEQAAALIGAAGWRLEVHSLTTTDFAAQIEGFERVNATVAALPGGGGIGIDGLRWVIAHVPFITREYLARLKALGGGVNLSGWNYLAGRGPRAGPPFRDVAESGVRAGFGADGMNIAPMNPWVHAYYATTGRNALGELVNEGQQVDRAQVLRWYTRDNRWFLGGPDEALLGAVEVGRLGDLVVLNDDYFSVSDEDLKKIRSVLTVVGGVVVHDAGVLG